MNDVTGSMVDSDLSWLTVQSVETAGHAPNDAEFHQWATMVFEKLSVKPAEVTVRLVDEDEMQMLNRDYRGIDKSTNVLSFPLHDPQFANAMLGDIVICAPVVEREAITLNKSLTAHWAHMLVHGLLHLLGYDHEEEQQAAEMESLETTLLQQLGFPPPYLDP